MESWVVVVIVSVLGVLAVAALGIGIGVWVNRRKGINLPPEEAVDVVTDMAPDEGEPLTSEGDGKQHRPSEFPPVRDAELEVDEPAEVEVVESPEADTVEVLEGGKLNDATGPAVETVEGREWYEDGKLYDATETVTETGYAPVEDTVEVVEEPAPESGEDANKNIIDIPDEDIVVESQPSDAETETVIEAPTPHVEGEVAPQEDAADVVVRPAENTAKHASQHFAATLAPSAIYGDVDMAELLRKVAKSAPVLKEAHKLGDGEFLGWEDENEGKFWWVVEAPDGAAALIVSDDKEWLGQHFKKLQSKPPKPLKHHQIGDERPPEGLLTILTEGQVVPAWESPEFAHLDDGKGYPVLPAQVRRAAADWIETPYGELAREYTLNGLETTAFVAVDHLVGLGDKGEPTLFVGVGPVEAEQESDFAGYAQSLGFTPYVIQGQGFLVEPVAADVTKEALDAQALALATAVTS